MPTRIHDVHQRWIIYSFGKFMAGNIIVEDEIELDTIGVGTSTSFPLQLSE